MITHINIDDRTVYFFLGFLWKFNFRSLVHLVYYVKHTNLSTHVCLDVEVTATKSPVTECLLLDVTSHFCFLDTYSDENDENSQRLSSMEQLKVCNLHSTR